jgi:hypothetical protein
MKYKFYFTDESKNVDNVFVAILDIIPEEKAIIDGPADNWYPGAPAQVEIEDIYIADKSDFQISNELFILLSKKIDNSYDDIIFQYKKEIKENKIAEKIEEYESRNR